MKLSAMKFSEMKKIQKLPTGVFVFDLLSKGGIPIGKFTLLYGDKSTGKSTFALRIIKKFITAYPEKKVCYVDFENTFDPTWAMKIIGFDPENLFIVTPAFAEEGIEFLQEKTKEREYHLVVIDSLANIISVTEADASADQEFMGYIARTINKMLRRMLPFVVEADRSNDPITVILINQIRSMIQQRTFYPQVTMPGGKYQEALSSLIVRFYLEKVEKKEETPTKAEFSFVIEKNKVGGVPRVTGKFVMDLIDGKVYNAPFMLNLLKEYKLLQQDKNSYVFDGEVFRTQAELKDRIENDEVFYEKVKNKLMEAYYGM